MNDLMTIEDIAEMNRCSTRHARDVLVRLPGFPEEAPTSTPRNRLWLRSDVAIPAHGRNDACADQPPQGLAHLDGNVF